MEFPYGECDCLAPIITEVELDHCRDCYGTCRGHWACYRHKRVGHLLPS